MFVEDFPIQDIFTLLDIIFIVTGKSKRFKDGIAIKFEMKDWEIILNTFWHKIYETENIMIGQPAYSSLIEKVWYPTLQSFQYVHQSMLLLNLSRQPVMISICINLLQKFAASTRLDITYVAKLLAT